LPWRIFPGPWGWPDSASPAARLLHQVVERMADMAASYIVAGFVHGVLNTDNMNVTGESFDYGPWRWLPSWDPGFTAAYFDSGGLYAFGRQIEAIHWNCGQLAMALRTLEESPPLIEALNCFGDHYHAAMARRWCWRLGVEPRGLEEDSALIGLCEQSMADSGEGPDTFFFAHRGGRRRFGRAWRSPGALQLCGRNPTPTGQILLRESLLIDEVEAIWAPIAEGDDWSLFEAKVAALRRTAMAHGPKPRPAGHA